VKLLNSNDELGQHAPSWYEATCDTPSYPILDSDSTCDVCVVGAGYTGLSAAIHLRKQGYSVIVLEAHRAGWGASGRNGGQLGSGLNADQYELEKSYGSEPARVLWQVCENAKHTIHKLCREYAIDIHYKSGIISALHRARNRTRFADAAKRYAEKLARDYDYPHLQYLSRSELHNHVDSPNYHAGVIDHGAGHIHPLKLATGLAKAASDEGVNLYEQSEVLSVDDSQGDSTLIKTSQASVRAPMLVLACNGYLDELHGGVQQRVMPINNFVIATEPLGARAKELLPADNAVYDTRFVVNYFRLSHDHRLLFGGGETYGYRFPQDIASLVRKPLLQVFPQLEQVKIDYTWGGTLAITRSRLPYVRKLNPGLYSASGYSGHGVALAVETGKLIADAINEGSEQFNVLAQLDCKRFPGGLGTRSLLLKTAMTGYALLDKI